MQHSSELEIKAIQRVNLRPRIRHEYRQNLGRKYAADPQVERDTWGGGGVGASESNLHPGTGLGGPDLPQATFPHPTQPNVI